MGAKDGEEVWTCTDFNMTHEERISELQDMSIEITEAQTQRE